MQLLCQKHLSGWGAGPAAVPGSFMGNSACPALKQDENLQTMFSSMDPAVFFDLLRGFHLFSVIHQTGQVITIACFQAEMSQTGLFLSRISLQNRLFQWTHEVFMQAFLGRFPVQMFRARFLFQALRSRFSAGRPEQIFSSACQFPLYISSACFINTFHHVSSATDSFAHALPDCLLSS